MPLNLLGTGQALDNSSPLVFADFLTIYDEMAIVKSSMDHKMLKPHTGQSWERRNYGRVQAFAVADGQDIASAQSLSDASTSITPSELAVQVILPGSTVRRTGDTNLVGNTGEIMGNAYALYEDTQLLTGFSGWTATALGSSSTVMSPTMAAALASNLRIGNNTSNPEPWPKPWFLIIHPNSGVPLVGRIMPLTGGVTSGATIYGTDAGAHAAAGSGGTVPVGGLDPEGRRLLREGLGAELFIAGMTVKYDANTIPDSSGNCTTAAFGKTGYIYVDEVPVHMDNDSSDKSMRGAVEYNSWGAFGQGQYRPAASGIPITLDASKATS